VHVEIAHTSQLSAQVLTAARQLMYVVFDDMTEHDWEHALGGLHALARDGDDVVGHAALVQRRLLHAGRALRAGYVEAVAVLPARWRHGIGAAVMAPLEQAIRSSYDLGALGATDEAIEFYSVRGWQVWRGPLSALTPDGIVPTRDAQGGVFVLQSAAELNLDSTLTCDWRDGDVW